MEQTNEHEIVRTAGSTMPVCEGNGTNNELWYTMPHHLHPNNTQEHIHGITSTLEKKKKEERKKK